MTDRVSGCVRTGTTGADSVRADPRRSDRLVRENSCRSWRRLGGEVFSVKLDYAPGEFTLERHIRGKGEFPETM